MTDNNIDTEAAENLKNADIILNNIFMIVDVFIMISVLLYFKITIKIINRLKYLLFRIFLTDIIIRLIYLLKYSMWNYFQILSSSFVSTFQFFLFLSFLEKIYSNITKIKGNNRELQKDIICFIFLLIIFPFSQMYFVSYYNFTLYFISIDKIIIIVQSLSAIIFSFKLYKIMTKKTEEIINIIKYDIQLQKIYNIIRSFPIECLALFTIYYLLIITFTLIKDTNIIFYGKLAIYVIKNASKFLIFLFCVLLLNEIKKINNKSENKTMDNNLKDEIDIVLK